MTVGKCRGGGGGDNKDQLFDFVEVNFDRTVAKFAPAASFATGIQQQQKVYTVRFRGRNHQHLQYQSHKQEQQEHDLCIEGAPPAPPACNSFANKTLCPFGRCEWNVTAKACGNWIPPPEICNTRICFIIVLYIYFLKKQTTTKKNLEDTAVERNIWPKKQPSNGSALTSTALSRLRSASMLQCAITAASILH